MIRGWLLDTSAAARSRQAGVIDRLTALLHARALYSCPLLDLEAVTVAPTAATRAAVLAERREAYRPLPMGAEVAERALRLQARLGDGDDVRQVGVAVLLVAATAQVHDVGVLHCDPAFRLLGARAGIEEHAVAPLGGAS